MADAEDKKKIENEIYPIIDKTIEAFDIKYTTQTDSLSMKGAIITFIYNLQQKMKKRDANYMTIYQDYTNSNEINVIKDEFMKRYSPPSSLGKQNSNNLKKSDDVQNDLASLLKQIVEHVLGCYSIVWNLLYDITDFPFETIQKYIKWQNEIENSLKNFTEFNSIYKDNNKEYTKEELVDELISRSSLSVKEAEITTQLPLLKDKIKKIPGPSISNTNLNSDTKIFDTLNKAIVLSIIGAHNFSTLELHPLGASIEPAEAHKNNTPVKVTATVGDKTYELTIPSSYYTITDANRKSYGGKHSTKKHRNKRKKTHKRHA